MTEVFIPVKPYVKRFLERRYGKEQLISKKNFLGIIVLELLDKKVTKLDADHKPDTFYKLIIPELYFNTAGFNVNIDKLKFLGRSLERLFIDDFYNFVDTELETGSINAYQSVNLYLQLHKIPESELKLESMYRKYQRYCNEKIKSKKTLLVNK